uniref:hypothetical protein n=1 Tax=Aliarcobacter sp. TaxID=2321116 RepID=UPI0040482742
MDIEEFKKKHRIKKKRTSILESFKKEILKLKSDDVSLANIQLFLKENDVDVTVQSISKFIRKIETEKRRLEPSIVEKNKINEEQREKEKSVKKPISDEARQAVKDLSDFFKKPIVN